MITVTVVMLFFAWVMIGLGVQAFIVPSSASTMSEERFEYYRNQGKSYCEINLIVMRHVAIRAAIWPYIVYIYRKN